MLTKYFLNLAIKKQGKNYKDKNYKDEKVQKGIGHIAGLVGLVINVLLFISKFIIGLVTSSIAVTADAFNNLSDSASSIITIVGFKFAHAPADKNHPYGHGRLEYLTALTISVMVIVVGLEFIKSSFNRIINPQKIEFDLISIILLLISILLKLWLSHFNKKLGDIISSSALKAIAMDAMGDVITTSVVVSSLLLSLITDFPIDGYTGMIVSIFILYSGFSLVKENTSKLIGEAPSNKFRRELEGDILSYKYILGVHDLIIHTYGSNKKMATIDVEVPADMDIVTIHNLIDQVERELGEKYHLHLVIHMDPVGFHSKEAIKVMNSIKDEIRKYDFVKSIHDFNIVGKDENRKVIFDVIVDGYKIDRKFKKSRSRKEIIDIVQSIDPGLDCNIKISIEY